MNMVDDIFEPLLDKEVQIGIYTAEGDYRRILVAVFVDYAVDEYNSVTLLKVRHGRVVSVLFVRPGMLIQETVRNAE